MFQQDTIHLFKYIGFSILESKCLNSTNMKVEVVSQFWFHYIRGEVPTAVLASPVPSQDRVSPTRNSTGVPSQDTVHPCNSTSTSSQVTR